MGRGRPRKSGARTRSGQLSRAGLGRVEPGERVQAIRHAFRWFQGGKAQDHVYDPIGRAWAVGLLDGFGADPAALRDAGREYGDHYWIEYRAMAVKVPDPDRSSRGGQQGGDYTDRDGAGERFRRLDDAVTGAGRLAHDALHNLCVDHHWFPDENPAWLDRLITECRVKERARRAGSEDVGPKISGALPAEGDREKLAAAVLGLLALVSGRRRPSAPQPPSLAELTQPGDGEQERLNGTSAPAIDPEFLEPRDVPAECRRKGDMRPWPEIADVIRQRIAGAAA